MTERHWHAAVLTALVLVAGARGTWWVAVSNLWQTDEPQHYAYAASLADGDGIPVIGRDRLPAEVLAAVKRSPVDGTASTDLAPSPADRRWGAGREQYEGGQGPTTYALLAAALGPAAGLPVVERVLVLRVLTMLMTLVTVPLTWLLTRALLPRRPVAWLLAPAVLVTWQGFNAAGATVNNDALVLPLATATVLGFALALRDGPRPGNALLAGLAGGLAVVTKASAVVVAGPVLLLALAALVRHRRRPGRILGWILLAAASLAATLVPWLRWQEQVYGTSGGAVARFNRILGPVLGPPRPPTSATVLGYWRDVTSGLFGQEFLGPVGYGTLVLTAVAAAALLWLVAAARRGDGRDMLTALWLAAALPLGFATMAAVVQLVLDGVGTVAGRYLHVLLPLAAILLAGGAVAALGRRAGTVVVVLLVAVTLRWEVALADRYVDALYQRGLPVVGVAPAATQEIADRYATLPAIGVDPPCPAQLVALAFPVTAPSWVRLEAAGTDPRRAERVAVEPVGGVRWGYYDTGGLAETFTVRTGDRPVATTVLDRSPAFAVQGGGDPVARVYCDREDPAAVRFAQLFHPQHPDLALDAVRRWPRAWALAGAVAAMVTLAAAIGHPRAAREGGQRG